MAKIRQITLQQNGEDYTILSYTNTAQLSVGQRVDNARLAYWSSLPDVRFKVVAAPAERESDLDESSQPEMSVARISADFEVGADPLTGQIRAMAAEFDSLVFDHAPEHGWGTERTLSIALEPRIEDAMDTATIKAKISQDGAIALLRREAFRALNLSPDSSGDLKARANALAALRNLVSIPQPF